MDNTFTLDQRIQEVRSIKSIRNKSNSLKLIQFLKLNSSKVITGFLYYLVDQLFHCNNVSYNSSGSFFLGEHICRNKNLLVPI